MTRKIFCSACYTAHEHGCPNCASCRKRGRHCGMVHLAPGVLRELGIKKLSKLPREELIKNLSEKLFEQLRPMAAGLADPVCYEYGPTIATNVLTNAVIALTSWHFGNQMGAVERGDSDQKRRDYCAKIQKKLFELLEMEKPKVT